MEFAEFVGLLLWFVCVDDSVAVEVEPDALIRQWLFAALAFPVAVAVVKDRPLDAMCEDGELLTSPQDVDRLFVCLFVTPNNLIQQHVVNGIVARRAVCFRHGREHAEILQTWNCQVRRRLSCRRSAR